MANVCVYIKLDPYLAQWFIHEQGGNYPVKLMRNAIECSMLEQFLEKPSDGFVPDTNHDGKTAILIPSFRFKDKESFNYLPPNATEMIEKCILRRFDLCMWNTLHRFSSVFHRQDNLIYAFMEKHGIEINDTNWNAIAKRYQRKREYYLMNERRKKMRKKNPKK